MAPSKQAKRDRKREAKLAARDAKLAAQRRARRRALLRRVATVAALAGLVGLIAGGVYLAGSERRAARDLLGDRVVPEASLRRDHIPSATQDPTPTSGPHSGPAVCGVQSTPVPADAQIHALEHGAVAFQYRQEQTEDDEIAALEELAAGYDTDVLVAPNPALDAPIVATAWRHRMRLDEADPELLEAFTTAFRGRGPENVDCPT